jgi:predicted sulfurtransferase
MFNIQDFYKIKSIVACSLYKEKIKTYLLSKSVKDTVILSPEGINGTIEGRKSNVNSCIKYIKDRFSMRQKQTLIARKSNKSHIYQKEY